MKLETKPFRFIKAIFRDNILFICFKATQEIGEFSRKLRNLYIKYKIIAFNHEYLEYELVEKSAVRITRSYLIVKIELNEIKSIEETEVVILSINLHLLDGRNLIFPISQSISLINTLMNDPDMLLEFNIEKELETNVVMHKNKKIDQIQPKCKELNENLSFPINKEELCKSLDLDFNTVNEKIEQKLNSDQTIIEIDQLVYRCIALLLSALPMPHDEEDCKISPIINAIQRYIEIELIKDRSNNE